MGTPLGTHLPSIAAVMYCNLPYTAKRHAATLEAGHAVLSSLASQETAVHNPNTCSSVEKEHDLAQGFSTCAVVTYPANKAAPTTRLGPTDKGWISAS